MTLPQYIRTVGVEVAAATLGISARAARSYLYRHRMPRPATALQMVRRSAGRLTMASIYSVPWPGTEK